MNLQQVAEKYGISLEQLEMGIQVEKEHDDGSELDVVKSKSDLVKIALAHLKEDPEYYTKLRKMETNEVAPPGREAQVKRLKKEFPKGSPAPFKIAWAQAKKKKKANESMNKEKLDLPVGWKHTGHSHGIDTSGYSISHPKYGNIFKGTAGWIHTHPETDKVTHKKGFSSRAEALAHAVKYINRKKSTTNESLAEENALRRMIREEIEKISKKKEG